MSNIPDYVIVVLGKDSEMTHAVIDDEHYVIKDHYFCNTIDELDKRCDKLDFDNEKYITLNSHAFYCLFLGEEMQNIAAQLNIVTNYEVKQ